METRTDVLIVGSGASGASLAHFLSKKNIDFKIIESISKTGLDFNKDLIFKGAKSKHISPVQTVHGFGGGTNLWGGGLVELDKNDFSKDFEFGSSSLFHKVQNFYEEAWKFFGFKQRPSEVVPENYEIGFIQKDPLNFSKLVNSKNLIYGEILKICKNRKKYEYIEYLDLKENVNKIKFNKLILCNGTMGILSIINSFQEDFNSLPLDRISAGLFTHPKISLKPKDKDFSYIFNSIPSSNLSSFSKTIYFRDSNSNTGKRHAIRLENSMIFRLESLMNTFKWLLPFTAIRNNISFIFRKIFVYWDTKLTKGKYTRLKLYFDSLEPNFIPNFLRSNHISQEANIELQYNSNSIDIKCAGDFLQKTFNDSVNISFNDINLAHSHYFGGLKLKIDDEIFIDNTGKVVNDENLWINGVVLLNAHGYANPILSIVAISSLISDSITEC